MKKFLSILLCMLLFSLPCAYAEDIAEDIASAILPWYELSEDGTVLTIRLEDMRGDDMSWQFEISIPEAFELLTQEVVGEDIEESESAMTYAASFRSFASAENHVSLILKYTAPDSVETPAVITRVVEMYIDADNVITIASILERDQTAEWAQYDEENRILTVQLNVPDDSGYRWITSLLDPETIEDIDSNADESGFIGSYKATMKKSGFAELSFHRRAPIEGEADVIYTVDMFVNENGELLIKWVDVFTFVPMLAAE